MDNIGDWIYFILLIVVPVLSSLSKKKAKKQREMNEADVPDMSTEEPAQASAGPRRTWEEMMRDLQRSTEQARREVREVLEPQPEPVVVPEPVQPEPVFVRPEPVVKRPEPVREPKKKVVYKPVQVTPVAVEEVQEKQEVWALNSLDDAKRAFVYSEIFNRKY